MMDELDLVGRLRDEVPLWSADQAEHAFRTAIKSPPPRPARGRGPGLRFRRRLRLGAVLAVPLAAAAAAAGLTLLPGHASPPGSGSGATSAAHLLAKIAAAADAQPTPVVRDDQFMYVKSWGGGSTCANRTVTKSGKAETVMRCTPNKPQEAQFWFPVSSLCATGAFRVGDGKLTTFSFKAASGDPAHFSCQPTMNYPTYQFLQTLPTDPKALLKLIERTDGQPREDWWAFSTIGNLLFNGSPPSVTAALYRAAALIPGVTVIPDATDPLGRHGVAVALTAQGMRNEWIFNRQTLQYLGTWETQISDGTLISQTGMQQRAIVDRYGQLPS